MCLFKRLYSDWLTVHEYHVATVKEHACGHGLINNKEAQGVSDWYQLFYDDGFNREGSLADRALDTVVLRVHLGPSSEADLVDVLN
jgi:hypothetical protein